jgi:hypothetical protein
LDRSPIRKREGEGHGVVHEGVKYDHVIVYSQVEMKHGDGIEGRMDSREAQTRTTPKGGMVN